MTKVVDHPNANKLSNADPVKLLRTPLPLRGKVFSLNQAARYLKMNKGTLRSALVRGEIPHTITNQGHYHIAGPDLFQYEQNRDSDQTIPMIDVGIDPPTDHPAELGQTGGQKVGQTSSQADQLMPLEAHYSVVKTLENVIDALRGEVSAWREESNKWSSVATDQQKLLSYDVAHDLEADHTGAHELIHVNDSVEELHDKIVTGSTNWVLKLLISAICILVAGSIVGAMAIVIAAATGYYSWPY